MVEHKGRERIPARQWRTLSIQSLELADPVQPHTPPYPDYCPSRSDWEPGTRWVWGRLWPIYTKVSFIWRKRKHFIGD